MLSIVTDIFFDAGIGVLSYLVGPVYALIAFVIVVFLEAKIMRKRFSGLDRTSSLKNSFRINLISTLIGFLVVFYGAYIRIQPPSIQQAFLSLFGSIGYSMLLPFLMLQNLRLILIMFLITVAVECIILSALLQKQYSLPRVLQFTFLANAASYLAIFLIPVVVAFLGLLLSIAIAR